MRKWWKKVLVVLVAGAMVSLGTGQVWGQNKPMEALCKSSGGEDCAGGCGENEMYTALGCMSTDVFELAPGVLVFLLGVAGLFFLAQIIMGAFKLVTSSGDPRAAQQGRERIMSATIALLFIILSATILRLIAGNILHLPGFFDAGTGQPAIVEPIGSNAGTAG